jgi:ABC-type multidrug transport system ATPase subunit
MMTGFLEPSAGTAVICGRDIRTDMNAIYSLMGVCPQHDLLWDTLTGARLVGVGALVGLGLGRREAAGGWQ